MRRKNIYVISDLHLGGQAGQAKAAAAAGETAKPARGHKMFQQGKLLAEFINAIAAQEEPSELVINGDFVDFLAERPIDNEDGWTDFHRDPVNAAKVFKRIANEREKDVFDALRTLVTTGKHRLVVLLGNHDLELAMPQVQAALRQRVGGVGDSQDGLKLLLDDTPYRVGDVLVAHGNQADPFNWVDHEQLRALCSRLHQDAAPAELFEFCPPHGSTMVARAINKVKENYPFVDLLKPELPGMMPMLVALDPSTLYELRYIYLQAASGLLGKLWQRMPGVNKRLISSSDGDGEEHDLLVLAVEEALINLAREELIAHGASVVDDQTARDALGANLQLLTELLANDDSRLVSRVDAQADHRRLLIWLTLFCRDSVFHVSRETDAATRAAVSARVKEGIKVMVLGHTHFAKSEVIESEGNHGHYINTGTWADLMRMPAELRSALQALRGLPFTPEHNNARATAKTELRAFLQDLENGNTRKYTLRCPTFARISMNGGQAAATLCRYTGGDPRGAEVFDGYL